MTDHPSPHGAIAILSEVPYFRGLENSLLQLLADAAHRRRFTDGQMVFQEGQPNPGLFVVASGWLKIVKYSRDGRELVVHLFGPRDVFGAVPVFVSQPNPATAIALEDLELWLLERETLLDLVERHPVLARRIIAELAQRALDHLALAEELALRPVEARLARYLLERSREDVLHRRSWTTQAEMASELGTVPDVLNRALRLFVEQELIQLQRHQIRILDRQGLEARTT